MSIKNMDDYHRLVVPTSDGDKEVKSIKIDDTTMWQRAVPAQKNGTLPLSMYCTREGLKEWSITGNTEQDGEPTPTEPIEVKGTGERTKNLFDTDFTAWERLQTQEYSYRWCQKIKVEIGRTYTIWSTSTFAYIFSIMDKSLRLIKSSTTADKELTFVATEDMVYVTTLSTSSESNIRNWLSSGNFMLNSGSEPLPYEPFGYKITEVTRGKNLLRMSDKHIKKGFSYYGVTVEDVIDGKIFFSGVANGDTNLLIMDEKEPVGTPKKAYFLQGSIGGSVDSYYMQTQNGYRDLGNGVKISSEADLQIIRLIIKKGTDMNGVMIAPMISAGNTMQEYEPYIEPTTTPIYINSPLMADEVLNSEGKREVKWGCVDASTLSYNYSVTSGAIYGRLPNSKASVGYCEIYQSIYPYIRWENMPNNSFEIGGNELVIRDLRFKSVAEYKENLKGILIYYPLAEPTTETVDVPQIPTLKGTTVLDVDTEVQPKDMSAKYLSDEYTPQPITFGDGTQLLTANQDVVQTRI